MQVAGYVKNVAAVGMFVSLSSSVEARVKLGQLSNTFIEDPKAAFPVGQFVSGRIVSIQGDRCAVLRCAAVCCAVLRCAALRGDHCQYCQIHVKPVFL